MEGKFYTIMVCIFLCMIFMHIFDDFFLQSACLVKLKQKDCWLNDPNYNKIYKNDYKIALLMHSLSWSFCIHFPFMVYMLYYEVYTITPIFISLFVIMAWLHLLVDDAKANKKMINLVFDQSVHLFQIFASWFILMEFLPK